MDDTWTGAWARDLACSLPELFLYSKSDFYTPYKYAVNTIMNFSFTIVADTWSPR